MFTYTRITIDTKTGVTLDSYSSEPEFGNASAFISQLMSVPRQQCCTVQVDNTMMIVEHHQSTLIQARNLSM